MSGEYLEPSDMIDALTTAGWTKLNRHLWQSPTGAYFRGPYEAWRQMISMTKTKEGDGRKKKEDSARPQACD